MSLFQILKKMVFMGEWWHTPLIPTVGNRGTHSVSEFEVNLVYRASSRIAKPGLKKPRKSYLLKT